MISAWSDPAVLDVGAIQARDFLAAHAGAEQGLDQRAVAQHLESPRAAPLRGRRDRERQHRRDDQRQAPVDARRLVRAAAHHLARVFAHLLVRDARRQQRPAGQKAHERAHARGVGGHRRAPLAAVLAHQPAEEILERRGASCVGCQPSSAPIARRYALKWPSPFR